MLSAFTSKLKVDINITSILITREGWDSLRVSVSSVILMNALLSPPLSFCIVVVHFITFSKSESSDFCVSKRVEGG